MMIIPVPETQRQSSWGATGCLSLLWVPLSIFFSRLGVKMSIGRVRWNIYVSAMQTQIILLPRNYVHVRPGSRKLMVGRHLGEKSRLRRLVFGTIKRKWERHNSPKTTEVCIICLVDIFSRKVRLTRLLFGTIEVKWERQNNPTVTEVCSMCTRRYMYGQ